MVPLTTARQALPATHPVYFYIAFLEGHFQRSLSAHQSGIFGKRFFTSRYFSSPYGAMRKKLKK
jgi:hypothetical protein